MEKSSEQISNIKRPLSKIKSEQNVSKNDNAFKNDLFRDYLLQNCTEWTHGIISDLRVQPVLQIFHRTNDSDSIRPYTRFDQSVRKPNLVTVPETTDPPFLSVSKVTSNSKQRNTSSCATRKQKLVESYADLFKFIQTDKSHFAKIPLTNNSESHNYYFAKVKFQLLGTVESEDLIKPITVSLGTYTTFEQLKQNAYTQQESDKFRIMYRSSNNQLELKIEDDNTSSDYANSNRDDSLVDDILYRTANTMNDFNIKSDDVISLIGVFGIFFSLLYDGGFYAEEILWVVLLFTWSFALIQEYTEYVNTSSENDTEAPLTQTVHEINPTEAIQTVSIKTLTEANKISDRLKENIQELQTEIQQYPREVTAQLSEDGMYLTSLSQSEIKWKIRDAETNQITTEAINFFVEYGFEKEPNTIDTVMVKSTQHLPDNLPRLESEDGNYYLLPEPVSNST